MRRLLTDLLEESPPGRAMMGAGIDENAVHVEDDGVSHT